MKSAKPLNKKHKIIIFSLLGVCVIGLIALIVTDGMITLDESNPLLWMFLAIAVIPLSISLILMPIFFKIERKLEQKLFEKLDSLEVSDETFTVYGDYLVIEKEQIVAIFKKALISKDGLLLLDKKGTHLFFWKDFTHCALTLVNSDQFLLSKDPIDIKNIENFSGLVVSKNIETEKCIKAFSGLVIDEAQYNIAKAEDEKELREDEASKFTYKLNHTRDLFKTLIIAGIICCGIGLGVFLLLVCNVRGLVVSITTILVIIISISIFTEKYKFEPLQYKYIITKNYICYNSGLRYFSVPWTIVKKVETIKNKIILLCEINNNGNVMAPILHMKKEPVVLARIYLMKAEHNLTFEIEEQEAQELLL